MRGCFPAWAGPQDLLSVPLCLSRLVKFGFFSFEPSITNDHRIFRRENKPDAAAGGGIFRLPVNVSQPAGPGLRHLFENGRIPSSVGSSRLLRRIPPLRKRDHSRDFGGGQPHTRHMGAGAGRINTGIKLSYPSPVLQTLDMSYQRFSFSRPLLR